VSSSGNFYTRPPAATTLPAGPPATTLPAYSSTTVVATTLPAGYIRVVPTGYTCRYVGGIDYRPVMYQGSTVYVVVR
jgi:hypothetical protein